LEKGIKWSRVPLRWRQTKGKGGLGRGSEDKKEAGGEVGVGHAVEVHASCVAPLRKMTMKGKKIGFWLEFDWVKT
jgi:hypothetical protein